MTDQVNDLHFWLHRLTKLSILLVCSFITWILRKIGPNVQETSGHIGSTHFSYMELEGGVVACVVSSAAVHCFLARRIGGPGWSWQILESDRLLNVLMIWYGEALITCTDDQS